MIGHDLISDLATKIAFVKEPKIKISRYEI
jgi:hypothetical protein